MTTAPIPNKRPGPLSTAEENDSSAFIDLTVQGSRFSASLLPPQVFVNGHLLPRAYGTRTVPVAAGEIQVDVFDKTWRGKQVSLELSVSPGQHVPVFYAPPLHKLASGSIGYDKQARPGKRYLVAMPLLMILAYLAFLSVVVLVFLRVAGI